MLAEDRTGLFFYSPETTQRDLVKDSFVEKDAQLGKVAQTPGKWRAMDERAWTSLTGGAPKMFRADKLGKVHPDKFSLFTWMMFLNRLVYSGGIHESICCSPMDRMNGLKLKESGLSPLDWCCQGDLTGLYLGLNWHLLQLEARGALKHIWWQRGRRILRPHMFCDDSAESG